MALITLLAFISYFQTIGNNLEKIREVGKVENDASSQTNDLRCENIKFHRNLTNAKYFKLKNMI